MFADQVDTYLHPRRERAQLKAVIENLYAKQPRLVEPNYELALTLAAKRNVRRTLFILLTDVTVIEAARRMQLYLRILTPRHLPLVVTIADETLEQNELLEPRTAEEFYRVGVATELMYERTLLLGRTAAHRASRSWIREPTRSPHAPSSTTSSSNAGSDFSGFRRSPVCALYWHPAVAAKHCLRRVSPPRRQRGLDRLTRISAARKIINFRTVVGAKGKQTGFVGRRAREWGSAPDPRQPLGGSGCGCASQIER